MENPQWARVNNNNKNKKQAHKEAGKDEGENQSIKSDQNRCR